jgi:RNA polymerase sigma-70 factor (ECF subfamily)
LNPTSPAKSRADYDPEVASAELLRRVAEHWADFEIPPAAFEEAIDELTREHGEPTFEDAVVVGLTVACVTGDPQAMRTFEATYFGAARRAVASVAADDDAMHEVIQRLRQRLFVAPADAGPAVLRAVGRGVRVAALRLALNLRRDEQRRHRGLDELAPVLDDPELRLQKAISIDALKEAFASAIAELSPKQRNLLRHHLVDHLNIDELAVRYGVHRATAARWLTAARDEVAELTRTRLRERLGDEVAVDQLRDLVQSRLDLSLTRLL